MPNWTISAPGTYWLSQDYTQSNPADHAIVINSHYVTLNLNGYRLVGAGGPESTNAGIYNNGFAACNILGTGGNIRGFAHGIKFENAYLARIQDAFIQEAYFRGISVRGNDAVVRNCDVREVHGAMWTPNAYCFGIEVQGMDAVGQPKVLDNIVQNVQGTGTGESVGIAISDNGRGGIVKGNICKNLVLPTGSSFARWTGGNSDVISAHNTYINWAVGDAYSSPTAGVVDENVYSGVATEVSAGVAITVGGIDG